MKGFQSLRRHPSFGAMAVVPALLLWLSQPPMGWWPVAFFALVPWLALIDAPRPQGVSARQETLVLWLAASLYWLTGLQGLRHANPLLYPAWIALALYLGVYAPLFVSVGRRLTARGVPLWLAAPVAWVGWECIRNYFLTGISATMLGHALADVPAMIQIADLFGSYGPSFVLVSANVAVLALIRLSRRKRTLVESFPAVATALVLVVATLVYGGWRLRQVVGPELASFALIQRSETVEYVQDEQREFELFQNYARQSVSALRAAGEQIDVVVWPESMFTGGVPWMMAGEEMSVPPSVNMTVPEMRETIAARQQDYLARVRYVQTALAGAQDMARPPELIVGCGVVHYGKTTDMYSGIVHLSRDGNVSDWYGKTHRVMFGEYVPIVPWIPVVRDWLPPGMGLTPGPGPKRFLVGETAVAPNICIETAVERVTIGQINRLRGEGGADVVVTVTNDGWFDDSSVLEHHLRCAQLVAVGCRRPILSAANNGPTAWIDSCGRVVERLENGTEGAVFARPRRDSRVSWYVKIGDWPARALAVACLWALWDRWRCRRQKRSRGTAAAGQPSG